MDNGSTIRVVADMAWRHYGVKITHEDVMSVYRLWQKESSRKALVRAWRSENGATPIAAAGLTMLESLQIFEG